MFSINFPIAKAIKFPTSIPITIALNPSEKTSFNKTLDKRFFFVPNARNTPTSLLLYRKNKPIAYKTKMKQPITAIPKIK